MNSASFQAQQWRCLECSRRQRGRELAADGEGLAADGEGLVNDAVGLAAGDDAGGSGVAGDAEGTAIARGCGEAADVAAEVPAVPAGSLRTAPATVLGPPTVPRPDSSSAIATAATMSSKAAAEAAKAVRTLVSSSQELMASRSLARPARRT